MKGAHTPRPRAHASRTPAARALLRAAALVVAVVTLAACGNDDYVFPSESTSASSSSYDLVAERKAAGIDDCIATAQVAPVEGGLPELTLGCLGGGEGSTLSALRGTPMVINFWAQWCGPCRTEAPHLTEVAAATKGKVQFIGVDTQDSQPAKAIAFAHEVGWTYPQLFDQDSLTKEPPLQVTGLPYTLLVDADGRIVHRIPGQIASAQQLSALIEQHLGVTA